MVLDLIAFDADDTLWQNETHYLRTRERFKELLSGYINVDHLEEQLNQVELENLAYFGYGIKSFILSMLQTAGQLTSGCITATDMLQIVQYAKDMLDTPVELLPGVQKVIQQISQNFDLMIITKGDLLDQRRKLAHSGLEGYFKWVEVVTDKTPEVYRELFETHHIDPGRFLMIGNSLRSDILPVINLGGQAVYIPYHLTWSHEHDIDHFETKNGYHEIGDIAQLTEIIHRISDE
jgi:putative hydrolase of the HAD superfamily